MEGGGAAAVSTEKQAEAPSYTYWVRGVTQDAAPLPVPKKLTPEDLSKQSNDNSTHLGSAWNRVFITVLLKKKAKDLDFVFDLPWVFLCNSSALSYSFKLLVIG